MNKTSFFGWDREHKKKKLELYWVKIVCFL